jgi:hypothetical protein
MSNVFKYGDIAYQNMQLVNRQKMSLAAIDPAAWNNMASVLQLIPITVSECKFVCTTLPIVFSPVDKPMPIAITGFTPKNNPFFTNGEWEEHTYIPLAVKRYPFALADINEQKKQLLYVDSDALTESNKHRLFDEEKNTVTLDQAIKLCKTFDEQTHATSRTIELINEMGLFKETQLIIKTKDGTEKKTSPFKIIDVEKLSHLSDDDIVKLQKSRGLWLIDAHIISMTNIESIARKSLSL